MTTAMTEQIAPTGPRATTGLTELDLTPGEIGSGEISAAHLSAAVEALKIDGIVILNNAVDLAHVEALRARMLEDLKTILAREDCPYNFTESNVQHDPPPFHSYLFKDVLLNEIVIAITHAMLGPGLKNSFYSGNTALPSEMRQPVHPDTAHLWRGLDAPSPPFAFVVNVPVMDVTVENGATEIWPGSHHDTSVSIFDRDLGEDGLVSAEARVSAGVRPARLPLPQGRERSDTGHAALARRDA